MRFAQLPMYFLICLFCGEQRTKWVPDEGRRTADVYGRASHILALIFGISWGGLWVGLLWTCMSGRVYSPVRTCIKFFLHRKPRHDYTPKCLFVFASTSCICLRAVFVFLKEWRVGYNICASRKDFNSADSFLRLIFRDSFYFFSSCNSSRSSSFVILSLFMKRASKRMDI